MIDVNGIEYKNCPRCNSEWYEVDGTFMCSKYFNKCIVASKTFNKFVDYYGRFTCSKCRNTANIILPILPYDISIEDINVCMQFI